MGARAVGEVEGVLLPGPPGRPARPAPAHDPGAQVEGEGLLGARLALPAPHVAPGDGEQAGDGGAPGDVDGLREAGHLPLRRRPSESCRRRGPKPRMAPACQALLA